MTAADVLAAADARVAVGLDVTVPEIRGLYRRAKRLRWDPVADVPWDAHHVSAYSEEVRWAARLYWSGRAWGEYGAISESPALQLRFEADRLPADLTLFWAMRTQEEARHAEASALFAEAMGGYLRQAPDRPGTPSLPPASGASGATPYLGTRARAWDTDLPLEATIAGLVCVAEQTVYDVFLDLIRHITNPAAKRIFQLIVRDETRHCEFGWAWLTRRAPELDPATKAACRDAMAVMVQDIELGGYRAPWLAADPDPEAVRLEKLSFDAGLGGVDGVHEGPVLVKSIVAIRERARAVLGVELPTFHHPRLGRF